MNGTLKYFLSCLWLVTMLKMLASCENDASVVKNLNKKVLGVETAKDVKLVYTSGGKTKAILTAPVMLHVEDTTAYYEFPERVKTDFYNEFGKIDSWLSAKYARYKEAQSIVFLKDSVKVVGLENGDTLYCDELYWDRNKTGAEFYTDKPVKIRTRTQTLDGVGMEARQDFKKWLILKPRGPIAVPESKFPM